MRPALSAEASREFDRSHQEAGVPGIVLMENAGRGAAHLIGLKAKPRARGEAPRQGSDVAGSCIRCADERALSGALFVVVAGGGNNGGDGFVVARHLVARGANVRVFGTLDAERYQGDALAALRAMTAVGVALESAREESRVQAALAEADVVVDALLGTGVARPLEGLFARLVAGINEASAYVIALDLPSGLCADTGAILGDAVRADHTVTFAHLKTGLLTTYGHDCGGTITVSHIGVPASLPARLSPSSWLLEDKDVRARLERRSPVAHKGTGGRVVVVGGTPGTLGAARLAAHAALRTGAGLVTIASGASTIEKQEAVTREVMTCVVGEGENLPRADVVIVGPGLGQGDEAVRLAKAALLAPGPIVLDADALRLLADGALGSGELGESHEKRARWVLTPHAGEAGALLGKSIEEVESDRFSAAQGMAQKYGCVVVLKGSRPIISAPGRTPVVSAFGSVALATGGSGDVLSGVLGAVLVGASDQEELFQRTQTAVAIQGICAERWTKKNGDRGLLASEIADLVPALFRDWLSE